eukprot:COSAG06_NODE_909_length_11599_cov_61.006087_3_plen_44_part_00
MGVSASERARGWGGGGGPLAECVARALFLLNFKMDASYAYYVS